MAFPIEMPQLSSDGESATLATWLVSAGDAVEKGDVIAELETDKSTVELEAPASGTIAELLVDAGTEGIAPGAVLGTIDSSDAAESAPRAAPSGRDEVAPVIDETPDATPSTVDEAPDAAPSTVDEAPDAAPSTPDAADTLRASTPLARRAALEHGLDLRRLEGSGPGGRIVEADVLRAAGDGTTTTEGVPRDRTEVPRDEASIEREASAEGETPREREGSAGVAGPFALDVPAAGDAPFESRRLSAMRRTIARRMTESKQQVPHFYLRMRCSMDAVLDARARLNAGLEEEGRGGRLSLNDFVIRGAALALHDVPEANVRFAEDVLHVYGRVDVSVAVATEGGLVTPVVREADRKGLVALSEEIGALAAAAREGRLRPEQYQGGTFTVSNLGMYGIETVYPILNPPQACILGVGAAEAQPIVRDGEIAVGRIAAFTLAADHRAVDGAVGARLLAALRERLEDPLGMVL